MSFQRFSGCLLAALLVACGGGGGSSDDDGGAPVKPANPPLKLTQQNAMSAATTSMHHLEILHTTSLSSLAILLDMPLSAGITSIDCSNGGSEDIEFRDNDSNGNISSGDVVIVRDRQCAGAGYAVSGDTTATFDSFGSGRTGTRGRVTGSVRFDDFSYSGSGSAGSFAIDGEVDFELEPPADIQGVFFQSLKTATSPIEVSIGTAGNSKQAVITARKVSVLQRRLPGQSDYEIALDATVAGDAIGGRVDVSTSMVSSAALRGLTGQYPTAGAIKIVGADRTEVRLIPNPVISSPYLAVSLDEKGNGVFTDLLMATPAPTWNMFLGSGFIGSLP